MGDVGNNILSLFGLSDKDKAKYDLVVVKFEAHFVKKKNVIFEKAKFNQHKQEEGKPVDDFVTSLYCLSEHCRYGDLRDEMIHDRIVVGLQDSVLSQKLQLKPNLTLEMAITFTRQKEQAGSYQSCPSNIDANNLRERKTSNLGVETLSKHRSPIQPQTPRRVASVAGVVKVNMWGSSSAQPERQRAINRGTPS